MVSTLPDVYRWLALGWTAIVLGLAWVLPHLGRRDFLFGVYVGVDRRRLGATRTLLRRHDYVLALFSLVLLVSCPALWALGWQRSAMAIPPLAAFLGGVALYLRGHNRARAFGVRSPRVAVSPAKEIPLVREAVPLLLQLLPWLVLAGLLGWTWWHWKEVPAQVPRAWGQEGPVAWGPRSALEAFLGPTLACLLLLLPLHLLSWTVAQSRPRLRDPGSPERRRRISSWRRAWAWYLWGLSMLMAAVVAYVQWDAVRGWIGTVPLARGPVVAALCVTFAGLLGAVLVTVRLAASFRDVEARTELLPRESRWVAGLLYFNPDDPAFLLLPAYGQGFTVNFGNRHALLILAGVAIVVLSLLLLPLLFFTAR